MIQMTNTLLVMLIMLSSCMGEREKSSETKALDNKRVITGADQIEAYVPYLEGKRVGMVINQTSIIGDKLSVDSLLTLGVDIKTIFGPEHGFRQDASNGAAVGDEIDPKTGIAIVSLYGKNRKPSKAQMDSLDIVIFDVQDVGCRFYTYINTLAEIMETCAAYDKKLLILDRPNPNGFVDGPILDMRFKSGIGKFPIPITHGMTIGEFAQMLNGEGWLTDGVQCDIKVIPVKNYSHDLYYELPVSPSPNLNSQASIILYPSLCLFEGTIISQGRGTYMPFTVLGAPELKGQYEFSFNPVSLPGMSETPLHQDNVCYGVDLRKYDIEALHKSGKVNLQWMVEFYEAFPDKERFFDSSQSKAMGRIEALIGNDVFKKQIMNGVSEVEIRESWEPGLSHYKEMRKQYLLYP
ncbi:exo-beta-N-acetylmuramidase NamZ family protein [Parapedobacter pyrenivorans]|uniref:exo-beta-N-acetylmuramidase NamZ family protein n=1 Tax=Parapedobacter pyrenivorans TaxID=1305674 RepID=UPI003DA774B9